MKHTTHLDRDPWQWRRADSPIACTAAGCTTIIRPGDRYVINIETCEIRCTTPRRHPRPSHSSPL